MQPILIPLFNTLPLIIFLTSFFLMNSSFFLSPISHAAFVGNGAHLQKIGKMEKIESENNLDVKSHTSKRRVR